MWYVEADDEAAAIERVWPANPSKDATLVDQGGMEVPHLEACLDLGAEMSVRRIRRFPRHVTAFYDREAAGGGG